MNIFNVIADHVPSGYTCGFNHIAPHETNKVGIFTRDISLSGELDGGGLYCATCILQMQTHKSEEAISSGIQILEQVAQGINSSKVVKGCTHTPAIYKGVTGDGVPFSHIQIKLFY